MLFSLLFLLLVLAKTTLCSKEDLIYTKKSQQSTPPSSLTSLQVQNKFECLKWCLVTNACISARFFQSKCILYETRINISSSFSGIFIKKKIKPTTIIDSFELLNLTDNKKTIKADHKSILYVLSDIFHGKSNIEKITFLGNNLESLDEEIFKDLDKLGTLDLSYNKFSNLGKFLKPLKNLFYLTLKKNFISKIDDELLKNLTNLQKLFLEENQISELTENVFSNLENLEILNISQNKIKQIHENTFRNLKKLKDLNLSKNNISNLNSRIFDGLANLKFLDLSFNHLKMIYFENVENLNKLKLSSNLINFFQTNLTSLKRLYLDNNNLGYLNYSIATKNESYNLEAIYLNNCNLNLITPEAFINFKNLSLIKLNSNPKLELNVTIFNYFNNLTVSGLDGN